MKTLIVRFLLLSILFSALYADLKIFNPSNHPVVLAFAYLTDQETSLDVIISKGWYRIEAKQSISLGRVEYHTYYIAAWEDFFGNSQGMSCVGHDIFLWVNPNQKFEVKNQVLDPSPGSNGFIKQGFQVYTAKDYEIEHSLDLKQKVSPPENIVGQWQLIQGKENIAKELLEFSSDGSLKYSLKLQRASYIFWLPNGEYVGLYEILGENLNYEIRFGSGNLLE
ncbi:MAG: DUF1036 domain-containing protein, partial [Planctomycetota bacterium]